MVFQYRLWRPGNKPRPEALTALVDMHSDPMRGEDPAEEASTMGHTTIHFAAWKPGVDSVEVPRAAEKACGTRIRPDTTTTTSTSSSRRRARLGRGIARA